ncbi:hypothetical protein ACFLVX_01970 [Chloroflexota bacterium]
MEPLFSEFSYGYAVTQELANGKLGFRAQAIFPSLRKEGQIGGGFDVKLLPKRGSPLFLQFKRSHYMKRVYSAQWSKFHGPYYKMPLMRSKYSMQHELLVYLELSNNNDVYYIAPEFYTDDKLTNYYWSRSVFDNSALFVPSDIGNLPDDGPHYIAFDHSAIAYLCSDEQKNVNKIAGGQPFTERYKSTTKQTSSELTGEFFDKITEDMFRVLDKNKVDTMRLKTLRSQPVVRESFADKVEFAGFLSRSYFDTELLIVQLD